VVRPCLQSVHLATAILGSCVHVSNIEQTRCHEAGIVADKMLGVGIRGGLEPANLERRQGKRFPLRLSCRVLFTSMNSRELRGVTRNISRSGVLVGLGKVAAADLRRTIGEPVEISIDLPHSSNFPPRCLVCMTRVIRIVDAESPKPSVACRVCRFRVEDRDKQASDGDAPFLGLFVSGHIQ
jgi:PilZ domain